MSGSSWLVICGIGLLLMRLGLSVYSVGMVRSRNAAGMSLRHILDMALAAVAFFAVGAAIAFAGPGEWINPSLLACAGDEAMIARVFFGTCAVLIAGSVVVGAAAERSRFLPMCAAPLLLGGLLVPLSWRLAQGWLAGLGYRDFAGASFIHLPGAICALVAIRFLGPRAGKYNRDGSSNGIPGHNLPLASAGMILAMVCWFAAVIGFSASAFADVPRLSLNVLLAACGGVIVSAAVSQVRYMKPDIHLVLIGLLGSLTAISASADLRNPLFALLVGAVAGAVVPVLTVMMDLVLKLDDPAGVVVAHGGGGVWGVLAAAAFAPDAGPGQRLRLVGVAVLGLLVIAAIATAASVGLFAALSRLTSLRSREADEFDGLDLAEHDVGAYPDFQQTMIKSYHLREA